MTHYFCPSLSLSLDFAASLSLSVSHGVYFFSPYLPFSLSLFSLSLFHCLSFPLYFLSLHLFLFLSLSTSLPHPEYLLPSSPLSPAYSLYLSLSPSLLVCRYVFLFLPHPSLCLSHILPLSFSMHAFFLTLWHSFSLPLKLPSLSFH